MVMHFCMLSISACEAGYKMRSAWLQQVQARQLTMAYVAQISRLVDRDAATLQNLIISRPLSVSAKCTLSLQTRPLF